MAGEDVNLPNFNFVPEFTYQNEDESENSHSDCEEDCDDDSSEKRKYR